jgi:hypothetical protein
MKAKLLLALLFPTFLISCIEVRSPKDKDKTTEEKSTPDYPQPVVEIHPLDQPQHYSVVIKNVNESSVIVRKPMGDFRQDGAATVTATSVQAEDTVDMPGEYSYTVQQNGQTYPLTVTIPQDYVVAGNMTIDQLDADMKNESDEYTTVETEGRFFFRAGAGLTTNGENLLIRAASIESEGALVQTFKDGQTAEANRDGRHGGRIKLEANSVRGTLHFIMRGENGGQTNNLLTKDHTTNGRNGGNSGLLEVEIQDQSNGSLTCDLRPGLGSDGVALGYVYTPPCSMPSTSYCEKPRFVITQPKGEKGRDGIAQQPVGIK